MLTIGGGVGMVGDLELKLGESGLLEGMGQWAVGAESIVRSSICE